MNLYYIAVSLIDISYDLHIMLLPCMIGFCDALGLGSSTKAAVIRRGLQETLDYCRLIAGEEFQVIVMGIEAESKKDREK